MSHAQTMTNPSRREISVELRPRLEAARLDLLALFRALDRMDLSPREIPQRLLRQLFELDADFAEALWALDQPEGSLDRRAILGDTLAALERLPQACVSLRKKLTPRAHPTLGQLEITIRSALHPSAAYNTVPVEIPETFKHPLHRLEPSMAEACATQNGADRDVCPGSKG